VPIVRRPRRFFAALLSLALFGALPAAGHAQSPAGGLRRPCDQLDATLCLLPFPNDRFTRPDPTSDTGRRVNFLLPEMPRGVTGKPIDPTEWNRQDGFSPGSMVLTFVPGLDLHQTWGTAALSTGGANDPADSVSGIARYAAPDAPILLVDAQTGARVPFWSELDHNASTPADQRVLIVRPAVNFAEGHTILVVLRNMRNAAGALIPAGAQFAAYRDNTEGPAADPTFEESRRAEVSGVIARVQQAEEARGIAFDRSQLFLAWQFTIASERNLSERVLHIRDDAFAQLGDVNLADHAIQGNAPRYTITSVADKAGDTRKLRQIDGTITVPNYLDGPPLAGPVDKDPVAGLPVQAVTGRRFVYGANGLPMQNPAVPFVSVPFVCTIPRAASAATPAHPMLYGHGLLGSRGESTGGSTERDRERNFAPCAVNWMGFADYDIANAVATLADPSGMPTMADRAQQGFLNFLYLGRALAHPRGLASNAAFQDATGNPLIATNELFYDGNSQGGIMGGALASLQVDATRIVLGVTGMNYSTLLNRSVDWEGPIVDPAQPGLPSYSSVLYNMFPDKREQQLVMGLIQMLWDRAEADGYAHHITTDPYPNTPAHQVLMHVAFGDFQVANFSAEVEARTVGARILDTSVPARYWDPSGAFGLTPFARDGSGAIAPWNGSALVYWDSGNLPPPNANVPPDEAGGDPHEDPRRDPRGADQKATFWLTGDIADVMGGGAYGMCRPGQEGNVPRVASQTNMPADWCVPGTLAAYGF
jgi:hypothetical protein